MILQADSAFFSYFLQFSALHLFRLVCLDQFLAGLFSPLIPAEDREEEDEERL